MAILDSEGLIDVMCKILVHNIQSFEKYIGFHLDVNLLKALL